jgi:hypothetical protein
VFEVFVQGFYSLLPISALFTSGYSPSFVLVPNGVAGGHRGLIGEDSQLLPIDMRSHATIIPSNLLELCGFPRTNIVRLSKK